MAIIVHGGAGRVPPEEREVRVEGCRRAALVGWARLQGGGSALDAVEAAVRVLEDDPHYDAGRGSYPNLVGEVEMDAIIMDGATLDFGAVAAVRHVRHPVTLARLVMKHTPHNLLVAAGAEALAREHGIPFVSTEELVPNENCTELSAGGDTVGAVALDAAGNLAAATSTGGICRKLPGRVGDSPLVGCGAYADNTMGAASATGHGEMLMRIVISKAACDLLAVGFHPQGAAERVIRLLAERVQGRGGIILLNCQGEMGAAHNTPHLPYAYVCTGREVMAGDGITSSL